MVIPRGSNSLSEMLAKTKWCPYMGPVDKGDLDRFLITLAELDGSDLVWSPARHRACSGRRARPLDDEPSFTAEETQAIAESIMGPAILDTFTNRHEIDFAYSLAGTGRFRVNTYYQRSSVALAMRRVR